MKSNLIICAACFLLFSCAQVPQESVELSATVGRDIAEAHRSHKVLAQLLFKRMKDDVNEFVDNVYAPYQIGNTLKQFKEEAEAGDEFSLFTFLNEAASDLTNVEAQQYALFALEDVITMLSDSIESYRAERLQPIIAQEKELIATIDRSYNQIINANSIVTGHLASVRKVYKAQEEVLNKIGLEDLRSKFGDKLVATSEQLSKILDSVKKFDLSADNVGQKIDSVKNVIDGLNLNK